jgi:hypothetical protein
MPQARRFAISAALFAVFAAAPAFAGGTIWFTENQLGPGRIRQATLDGTFITDAILGLDYVSGLAVDEQNGFVYWGEPGPSTNFVRRSNLDGSGAITLSDDAANPWSIALDATHAYVANNGAWITSVPLTGGSSTILANSAFGAWGIGIDATTVYWTENLSNVVKSMPKAGGAQTTLATPTAPEGLAITATHVYFGAGDKIQRVPIGGGAVTDVVTEHGNAAWLIIDSVNSLLYWTDDEAGMLFRSNLDGTAVLRLASHLHLPRGLALLSDPQLIGTPDQCIADKLIALGKRESGLLKCEAKLAARGNSDSYTSCIAKVDSKFQEAFAEAGACSGAETTCTQKTDDCVSIVRYELPDGASACEGVRLKAAARKALALAKCMAAAADSGEPIDVAPGGCVERAEQSFQRTFAKVSGCTGDALDVSHAVNLRCASDLLELDRSTNILGICP